MHDPVLHALTGDLSTDDRAALAAVLAEQPALADAFGRWGSLRATLRADLGRALPDRALLVLHALAGDPEVLSDDEQAALDVARPALDAALARHPGLAAAVRRIRDDRDAFEAAWREHAAPSETAPTRGASRRAERTERPADRPVLRRVRPVRWAARVAAVVAVVAFGSLLTFLALRDGGWDTLSGAQTVTLADGSTITLGETARLMVPEGDARAARLLGGDALFRIAHDPANPFAVQTPNAEIAVLGTTFAVDATDALTDVTLVEGRVTLAPRATPAAAVTLAPGERSRVIALDAPDAPRPADLTQLDYGRTVFAASGTPAGILVRELARRHGVSVAIDPELASEPMSAGEYGADGLAEALDVIARALGGTRLGDAAGYRIAQ